MRRLIASIDLPRRKAFVALVAGALVLAPAFSDAQQTVTAKDPKDTTHAQTQAPFFTFKDALLASGFAVGTVAMFPLDRSAAKELLDSATQANRFFKHASTGAELIASPGAYFIGGSLYIVGRVANKPRIADLGWHGTEAVLFGDGITYLIKGIAGRARPFLSNGTVPGNFNFGKGFSSGDFSSFPSGHATTAFAAAAAVTNETTRWWPRSTWIVGPIMYAGATAVGLSRMYHNRHWASDVVLGAAIGTFSGRKVVQYAHGHPHNLFDRLILRTSVLPDGYGGARVVVSVDP
ncbi:MAG: phosphatase PAP2 family protein [Gemmatimonadaceae bacterium]